jgi:DNA-binding HxlR family transcriptional regulator
MSVPAVGKPVRGSKTGRPIMVVLDLLGRRATLRILWELRGAPMTFRALQDACESNPSLVNVRLKELRESGLVSHAEGGYRLTEQGCSLSAALGPLDKWARDWSASTGSRSRVTQKVQRSMS